MVLKRNSGVNHYSKYLVLLVLGILFYSCSDKDNFISIIPPPTGNQFDSTHYATDDFSNTDYNILFIGNSLTYTNNLPQLVREAAQKRGLKLGTKMIALSNYALIDHWNDGVTQEQISSGKFDFVVVQQGPSSQAWGRQILIEYGEKYSELCKNYEAQLCFFMVWPSLTYYYTFDGVIKNYRDAATFNQALLAPAGEVWKQYFDTHENYDYYGPDGFHPSLKGSQVAAEVILDSLF